MADKSIFRAEALEQFESPEQLELLLKVTNRRAWVSLFTIGLLVASAVGWSVFGQIPITVNGMGVLIYPRTVISMQSPSDGQITSLAVAVGTEVKEGDLIGTIGQSGLLEQLRAEKSRLNDLTDRDQLITQISVQLVEMEDDNLGRQRELLDTRIAHSRQVAEKQLESQTTFLDGQLQSIDELIVMQKNLGTRLGSRYGKIRDLERKGLSSKNDVLVAEQDVINNRERMSELMVRAEEIKLAVLGAEETYQRQLQQVTQMESDREQLAITKSKRQQAETEAQLNRELEIQVARNRISEIQSELDTRGRIISGYSGRVLELSVGVGQIVGSGQRVGSIEAVNEDKELIGLTYLNMADGNKVKTGMPLRITPTSVRRERYGSIEAVVTEVNPFPVTSDAVESVIGSRDIAHDLMQGSSKIQISARLTTDADTPSGYKWTSGRGTPDSVTSGSVANVHATVEYRRPISFAIPLLRKWTGAS